MQLLPCSILGVFMKVTEQGAVPTVVLETEEAGNVPIYVGLWEALSISNAMRGEVLPRPITHDLFADLLGKCEINVHALHIDSLEGGVFYSKLLFSFNGHSDILDCRPSDGIAIALRVAAPIFMDESVCTAAAVEKSELSDLKDIRTFL